LLLRLRGIGKKKLDGNKLLLRSEKFRVPLSRRTQELSTKIL
jgi:hypothetical protein